MRAFITIIIIVALYFLPAFIAHRKRNSTAIFVLNLFVGWTLVGWVAALVWACMKDPGAGASSIDQPSPSSKK